MTKQIGNFGGFNARWLDFEDVARTFVPVPQFRQLVQNNHSLLLGPRGCGKTTLLKMLTKPALDEWQRNDRAERFQGAFEMPQFEAIYIPADVRWCYELASIGSHGEIHAGQALKSQRLMVCANILISILRTAERLIISNPKSEIEISSRIIASWQLTTALPNIKDIRSSVRTIASQARGYLASGDEDGLTTFLNDLSPSFFGHALDCATDAIEIITEGLPSIAVPRYWALCFDELEIGPGWLRSELLEALRSTAQNVLLKLTWTPLLPSGLRTMPTSGNDFKAVRLWHSHLADPKAFCEDLTRDFLRDRLGAENSDPLAFFSRSILAAEEDDEPKNAYDKDSTEYEVFKDLATWDMSFRLLMVAKGIDPEHPCPRSTDERNQFYRKVKPVVLLRSEFLKVDKRARSRKTVTVYAGREAIYAMSEGNPRWLLSVLNDLVDVAKAKGSDNSEARVSYSEQARILNAASRRFIAQIKASPFSYSHSMRSVRLETLWDLVSKVGEYFNKLIIGEDFQLDPVGSFVVPEGTDQYFVDIIEQLLDIGALIYVGNSSQDVPQQIIGSRFKLSNALAPAFKLPLRLYREIPLSEVLSGATSSSQLEFSL